MISRGARHVVVGISGGVDSSVAAYLLRERLGYRVTGVYMRNWDSRDEAGSGLHITPCPNERDLLSAREVCSHLGIPLQVVDFSHEYWINVFEEWVEGYRRGVTPNPDAACNRVIKFGAFRDFSLNELRGEAFATGHYAQVAGGDFGTTCSDAPPDLYSAVDVFKDQSDFLSMVPREAFRRCVFPLGAWRKKDVRALASSLGLPTATRPDSVGICFVGPRKLSHFLGQYLAPQASPIHCLATGTRLGSTNCAQALTVGQRVRVGGLPVSHYVVSNGIQQGQGTPVWAVPGEFHPALLSHTLVLDYERVNWLSTVGSLASPAQKSSQPFPKEARGTAAAVQWLTGSTSVAEFPTALIRFRERHKGGGGAGAGSFDTLGRACVMSYSEFRGACEALVTRATETNKGGPRFQPTWRRDSAWKGELGTDDNKRCLVVRSLEGPIRAIAPGQIVTLYEAFPVTEGGVLQGCDGIKGGENSAPPSLRGDWQGGGLRVIGAGEIVCSGPSLWETGDS